MIGKVKVTSDWSPEAVSRWTKEFRRLVMRLEKADTDQKRRSARVKLKAFFRKVDKAYPALVNGKPVIRKGPPPCPYCKAPLGSWVSLAVHLEVKHWLNGYECPCGFKVRGALGTSRRGMASHICARHKEEGLKIHLAKARLVQSSKQGP